MTSRRRLFSSQQRKVWAVGVASMLALAALLTSLPTDVAATPPLVPPTAPSPATPPAPTAASTSSTPASATGAEATEEAPPVDPTHATIIFNTTPPATANVTWGRKKLGRITPGKPLVVVRPRDSGPLDVMVRAEGYLPVQTRAHTFADSRVVVKLTPPESISELLGYRAPLDAGVESPEQTAAINAIAGSDGGVPSPDNGTFRVVPATPPVPSPLLFP